MTKTEFLQLLGEAYGFPGYYSYNLDSADEILADQREEANGEKLSLQPLFDALLTDATAEERKQVWALVWDHFVVKTELD